MRTYSMGVIYAVPNVAIPTPVPIASLKGCKVGVKQGKATFRGNNLDIVDVGNKGRDWNIEIDNADFRASALQLVVPGGVVTSPGLLVAPGEQQTIAATVTVANGAAFVEDGGVLDLTAGKWLTPVASAPAAGQYVKGAAGVGQYTFNAGDVGHISLIVYSYNAAGTVGQATTINNGLQGQSTPFKLRVYNPYTFNGVVRLTGWDFASVHFEELSMDLKVEDFAAHHLKGFASQDMIGTSLLTAKFWSSELG